MIAFVEQRPSGKWLSVLDETGDLVFTRRVDCESRPQGVLAPLVSRQEYDADRGSRGAANNVLSRNVIPFPYGSIRT
jgi:hypothetical protein